MNFLLLADLTPVVLKGLSGRLSGLGEVFMLHSELNLEGIIKW